MSNELATKKESAISTGVVTTENAPIKAMEAFIAALPQAEFPLDHFFSDGLYARKMTMKPSCLLVGHEHKQNHLAVLLKGQVAVKSKQGTAVYNAPYVVNVLVGDKRAFFSVTEVEWMTIHATTETDLNVIQKTVTGETI